MSPDDEVQITVTRMEAARMHAALAALCSLQQMMPGLPSAANLTDAVDVIEGVLPRLAECFPADEVGVKLEHLGADTKTYGATTVEPVDEFEVKVADLGNLTPKEASLVFASEYDDAIQALVSTLNNHTDWTHKDFHELLDFLKALMTATVPVPQGLTVAQSQPYVAVSDLLTLGKLAHEMYKRQDQIEDKIAKPF